MDEKEKRIAHVQARLDLVNKLIGAAKMESVCYLDVDGERIWLSPYETTLSLIALQQEYKRQRMEFYPETPPAGIVID